MLENEPLEISDKIKKLLDEGKSYPAARSKAYEEYVGEDILSTPNNILAVEYIRALSEVNSKIEPRTLCRKGTNYHDEFSVGDIASASAIREMLQRNDDVQNLLPNKDFVVYDEGMLDVAVISKIRAMKVEELAKINDVTEGLEYRIKEAVMSAKSIDDLCDKIKTKRYPYTKIRRIIFSAFLDITKEITDSEVGYIRPLAMNENGAKILRKIKEESTLDVITKVANYNKTDIAFEMDVLSTDMFSLCGEGPMGMDYKKSPVIVK